MRDGAQMLKNDKDRAQLVIPAGAVIFDAPRVKLGQRVTGILWRVAEQVERRGHDSGVTAVELRAARVVIFRAWLLAEGDGQTDGMTMPCHPKAGMAGTTGRV